MGTYLTTPKTNKNSQDGSFCNFSQNLSDISKCYFNQDSINGKSHNDDNSHILSSLFNNEASIIYYAISKYHNFINSNSNDLNQDDINHKIQDSNPKFNHTLIYDSNSTQQIYSIIPQFISNPSISTRYGVTEMQGWRRTMEDSHLTYPNATFMQFALYGVFDGHGGSSVSSWVSKHFLEIFQDELKLMIKLIDDLQKSHEKSSTKQLPLLHENFLFSSGLAPHDFVFSKKINAIDEFILCETLKNVFFKIDLALQKPENRSELYSLYLQNKKLDRDKSSDSDLNLDTDISSSDTKNGLKNKGVIECFLQKYLSNGGSGKNDYQLKVVEQNNLRYIQVCGYNDDGDNYEDSEFGDTGTGSDRIESIDDMHEDIQYNHEAEKPLDEITKDTKIKQEEIESDSYSSSDKKLNKKKKKKGVKNDDEATNSHDLKSESQEDLKQVVNGNNLKKISESSIEKNMSLVNDEKSILDQQSDNSRKLKIKEELHIDEDDTEYKSDATQVISEDDMEQSTTNSCETKKKKKTKVDRNYDRNNEQGIDPNSSYNHLLSTDYDFDDEDDNPFDCDDEFDKPEQSDENFSPSSGEGSDPESCGCTAVVALVFPHPRYPVLITANAGDSRVVLCRNGRAIPMSLDHKPEREEEAKRIENAGGMILGGRVDGNLNLTRSLGDLFYKQNHNLSQAEQKITALPDIRITFLNEYDEFAILACDGIWDCLDNQGAVDFVRERLHSINSVDEDNSSRRLSEICEEMCDKCLSSNPFESDGIGSDNMTCMIVEFKRSFSGSYNTNYHTINGSGSQTDKPGNSDVQEDRSYNSADKVISKNSTVANEVTNDDNVYFFGRGAEKDLLNFNQSNVASMVDSMDHDLEV